MPGGRGIEGEGGAPGTQAPPTGRGGRLVRPAQNSGFAASRAGEGLCHESTADRRRRTAGPGEAGTRAAPSSLGEGGGRREPTSPSRPAGGGSRGRVPHRWQPGGTQGWSRDWALRRCRRLAPAPTYPPPQPSSLGEGGGALRSLPLPRRRGRGIRLAPRRRRPKGDSRPQPKAPTRRQADSEAKRTVSGRPGPEPPSPPTEREPGSVRRGETPSTEPGRGPAGPR